MQTDSLPPYSPEAERAVLGCCLLDIQKASQAIKAGASSRWFFDSRHTEIFTVLAGMAHSGGGDALVAALILRDRGKLDQIGGVAYLSELQAGVPSAENLGHYLPSLRDYARRRQILGITARLSLLAMDPTTDPAHVLADAEAAVEALHREADVAALPEILPDRDFLAAELPTPKELVCGILHQGSKLILGGSSKSYKTWSLTDLAVSVATGTPWLGFPTTQGRVLYANLEIQPPFFQKRIEKVMQAKGVQPNGFLEIWNMRGCVPDYRSLIPKIWARIRDGDHALVIIDPTYKLLGAADENSATDITALLNMVESLAVHTGAAVALAGHFAKGNASGKEAIDRISGSGVFARDPDSLVIFTRHEEDGAFAVETVLRNLPPIPPFVVQWEYPLFKNSQSLDPARLKTAAGRPAKHTGDVLLECLGDQRLKTMQWRNKTRDEKGVTTTRFFELLSQLEQAGRASKSPLDDKWEQNRGYSGNRPRHNDE